MTAPTILYVDDERGNRVVFRQSLASRFDNIRTVASGREALEFLATNEVGVVVTDQRMPGMSGNDLLLEVRSRYPRVVRIVVTAYVDLDPILRAVNEGLVARYLIKPWDRMELENVLAWACETYELGRNDAIVPLRLLQTERLATVGGLTASIMHDIRQPLSYMRTNATQLERLLPVMPALAAMLDLHGADLTERQVSQLRALTRELPEIIDDMKQGCDILIALSDGVRNVLRPDMGEDAVACEPVKAIKYTLSICRGAVLQGRGRLEYEGPEELPSVAIRSTELIQTLVNLVGNGAQALRAKDRGGGRVTITARADTEAVTIVVGDEGIGMSAETLERLGTPFFTTRAKGAGLGVAQCQRIVEQVGGTLNYASELAIGTTVTMRLPRASSTAP